MQMSILDVFINLYLPETPRASSQQTGAMSFSRAELLSKIKEGSDTNTFKTVWMFNVNESDHGEYVLTQKIRLFVCIN